MGNKTLIYKEKLKKALNESETHLIRLKEPKLLVKME